MELRAYKCLILVSISALVNIQAVLHVETVKGQTSLTIWPATAVPAIADAGPDSAVELGIKFRAEGKRFGQKNPVL